MVPNFLTLSPFSDLVMALKSLSDHDVSIAAISMYSWSFATGRMLEPSLAIVTLAPCLYWSVLLETFDKTMWSSWNCTWQHLNFANSSHLRNAANARKHFSMWLLSVRFGCWPMSSAILLSISCVTDSFLLLRCYLSLQSCNCHLIRESCETHGSPTTCCYHNTAYTASLTAEFDLVVMPKRCR